MSWTAERFLCYLPLSWGVYLLLAFHVAQCSVTCSMAVSEVLMEGNPAYGYGSSTASQLFSAGWSLAGIPIIIVALWGVRYRFEPPVRFYLLYAFISFVIDVVYVVQIFLFRNACAHLSRETHGGSAAFACGIATGASATAAVVTVVLLLYFLYVVYSFCEELNDGGSAEVIGELLRDKSRIGKTTSILHAPGNETGLEYGTGDRLNYGLQSYNSGHLSFA